MLSRHLNPFDLLYTAVLIDSDSKPYSEDRVVHEKFEGDFHAVSRLHIDRKVPGRHWLIVSSRPKPKENAMQFEFTNPGLPWPRVARILAGIMALHPDPKHVDGDAENYWTLDAEGRIRVFFHAKGPSLVRVTVVEYEDDMGPHFAKVCQHMVNGAHRAEVMPPEEIVVAAIRIISGRLEEIDQRHAVNLKLRPGNIDEDDRKRAGEILEVAFLRALQGQFKPGDWRSDVEEVLARATVPAPTV